MKIFIIKLLCLTCLCTGSVLTYAQSIISVSFYQNGSLVDIRDNFEIVFVSLADNEKFFLYPKISDTTFVTPALDYDVHGHIVFVFDSIALGLGYHSLNFDQNMKWVIGFDTKPYSRNYYSKEANSEETVAVVYLEIHPLERGEGIVSLLSISDLNIYLNECRSLIQ